MASLEILPVTSDTVAAPAGIWFEAVSVSGFDVSGPGPGEIYDPSFHEITYIWSVRGNPLSAFTAPENMVQGWNDPNLAYGKKVSFLFNDPGTYTIDLWAVDKEGTVGIAETTVVVADPDAVYPGTRTVCFSTGGSWAGEKPGCQRITSLTALQSAINNANAPLRVLFRRGQVIPNVELVVTNGLLGYVGAWGTGTRPALRPAHEENMIRFTGSTSMTEFTVTDVDFRGDWRSDSEVGLPDISPFNFISSNVDCFYTIANNSFDGFTAIWLGTGTDHPAKMIFANNQVTNWRDYGLFIHNSLDDGSRMAVIGCKIAQHVDALNGGAKNGLYNTHGPIRTADSANFYIAITDLFSRTGWSALGPDRADQPCLRYNHLGTVGRAFNMDRCVCEGGFNLLSFSGQNNNTAENPGNFVIDKALLIGTAKSAMSFVACEFGGLTVRNTLGIMPNVPIYHGLAWSGGVRYSLHNPNSLNLATDQQIYSTSFLSLRNAANDDNQNWRMETGAAIFDTVTVENNVLHGPNLDNPTTDQAPVSTAATISGVSPRYRGVLYNFEHEEGNLNAAVSSGGSFTLPYPAGTNQSYWQSNQATDTRHTLIVGNASFYAARGEFSVTYQANNIRITNSSGATWGNNATWRLRLDRTSRLPALDANYANPTSALPVPVVQSGSNGFRTANPALGFVAYDDFFGTPRPTNPSYGAIEP